MGGAYLDYSGLKELLGVHERRAAKRCIEEEKEWLEALESGLPSPFCASVFIARIKNFLKLMFGMGQEVKRQSYSET